MNKNRIFIGIVFILMAVALIIGKLGYLGGWNLVSVVFSILLVAIIIKSIFSVNFAGILFPIAFLCILYDKQLHIETLTPWTVLIVALLGTIGLSILFGKKRRSCIKHHGDYKSNVINEEDNSQIHQSTHFGATTKYINSDNFTWADFDCSFGALAVYFENAKVPSGTATLEIHASFSGTELYIPKEWKVENHMNVSLGAVEEKNHATPDGSVTLHLIGSLNFGGIEIIYV